MKKNYELRGYAIISPSVLKLLVTMKLILVCLCAVGLLSSFGESYAQNGRLSVEMHNSTIEEVLDFIEDNTDYSFMYDNKSVDVKQEVSINVKDKTIESILNQVLSNEMNYQMVGKHIIITKKNDNVINSQQSTISGEVTDSEGLPLPGVTVVVKGTTLGTVTGADGNYSLTSVPSDATLIFSFVGMKSKEISVAGQTKINVTLEQESIGLEEVVAIGYGTVKKSDITGSVGSIESDAIAGSALPDATRALQGRVAGVNIEQNVGKPGGSYDISIRGLSSINNSNTPLYVIDGIPTTSGMNDLNPSDIEKIDILKDASATAIYGSRGANGVVIVTTKKGKTGKFSISYDGYYGFRTAANLPDMMTGPEYVQWRTDLFTKQGKSTDRSNAEFFTPEEWTIIDSGNYTDWFDLILRNGVQTSNTVTASGGDDKGSFALSFGQLKEEGTVPGQDFNRYNMRLNLNRKFSEKWEAGGSLYFTYSLQNEGSYETLRSTFRMPPVAYPYDENGRPRINAYRQDYTTNPMFEYSEDGEIREHRRYRAFGNIFLQFEPIRGLTLRSQFSPQMIYKRDGEYYGLRAKNGGHGNPANVSAYYNTTDYFGYVWDNQLNYTKDIQKHSFNFSFIQSIQYDQWEKSNQSARNFPFNSLWYNLDAATLSDVTGSGTDYSQASLASFTGRLNYSYNGKYLFTATGRYDGSSRLAEGNKWAFFPSAAFAWRVSEEDFLKNSEKLSNLKLRLTYGVTGNDAVDIYGTQSNVSQSNYNYNDILTGGYYKSGLANLDLTWEKTTEINLGVDYGFYKNRINGSIDVYRRDAKDLIMRRQLPQTSGWSSIWDNVGWVRNTGIELGINTVNVQTKNFTWSTSIIFDTNKNEIVELYGEKKDDLGNRWFIGKPIQVNYDYEFDGIWQSDEADLAAKYGQTPGQIKVKDLNSDDKIDANDRKIIGQRTPKWSGSITNTLNYKNWDFSLYVYTRQGEQLYSTFVSSFMSLDGNYNNVNVDYWTANNPSNKYPQPGNKGNYFNNYRYRDVSFVRVGNISLGYTVPKQTLSRLGIKKLRLYGSVTNPFTFTKYPGYDPEWADQNTWGEATGYASYLFGINLEL
ncbi:TonB-dependent receptor [Mangrovibacterium marinum]|uniref:TonB-dependent receptor n=1 Tax=Mangrovibacterium marinum TaxID=1639118 RepID=UPI002A18DF3C|nr:TonB-dependent receptor [Mangrovibacterium marinum]